MGRPKVVNHCVAAGNRLDEVITLLAALELESMHPLADALLIFAAEVLCADNLSNGEAVQSSKSARQQLSRHLALTTTDTHTANGMGMYGQVRVSCQ